jgi:hypothetical protein
MTKLAPLPNAAARGPEQFLAEIYMAGLWHGAEIMRAQTPSENGNHG